MSRTPLLKFASAALVIAVASGIAVMWYQSLKKTHYLGMVPAGVAVSEIIYAHEESWGFGPGGNETGVIIFGLQPNAALNLQHQGDLQWKATPALVKGSDSNTNSTMSYDIGQYLNRYGFGLLIDEEVTRTINDALSSQGNFVQDDPRRLIIIIPKAAKLVIAYRG